MNNRFSEVRRGIAVAVRKRPLVFAGSVVVIAAAIAAIVLIAGQSGSKTEWGKNTLASGLPEISAAAAEYSDTDGAFAAYYSGVTLAQAEEYACELEAATGKSFSGKSYPRVLNDENRIITLHMNISENKLSVTVIGDATQENTSK